MEEWNKFKASNVVIRAIKKELKDIQLINR